MPSFLSARSHQASTPPGKSMHRLLCIYCPSLAQPGSHHAHQRVFPETDVVWQRLVCVRSFRRQPKLARFNLQKQLAGCCA